MLDIQPKHLRLRELMQNRLFRIPDYQRNYSWGRKQRQELFEDIRQVYQKGDDRLHFMATLVGLRRGELKIGTDEHSVVEIVDGQQRITTLVVLLKAIANAMRPSTLEEAIKREIASMLVKDDEATLLLLQTNHDTSGHFTTYMRKGTHTASSAATTFADREILAAMEECEEFVAKWLRDGYDLGELVWLLKNRLSFVFHEVGDEKLVYTVFEVLNSRGLEVSWFDSLKSMLMANVFESTAENKIEIINEVHWEWAEIYRIVGLRLGLSDESMRVSATLRAPNRPYRPLSAEDAARVLNERSLHGPNAIVETTSWLKEVTSTLNTIEADRRISGVTSILQARMVAAAIYLRSDISAEQRNGLLRKWENVTFRVYGCYGEDARKRVGDYVSLAWDIAHALPAEDIVTRLTDIGMQFPIDRAIERLPETVCNTDWSTQLHYFFRRYEEHLSAQAGQKFNSEQWNRIWEKTNSDSIEHIRPQNEWSNSEDSRVHSLGNLMILPPGLNSKLQDKPVTEKAKAYRETGLLLANEIANSVAEMRIKSHWTLAAIEAREKSLLKWARQEWAD